MPVVLLCDMPLLVLTLAIVMSNARQRGATSSDHWDPQPPHKVEFEGEHIDCDAANVEMLELTNVQSRRQHAVPWEPQSSTHVTKVLGKNQGEHV